MSFSFLIVDTPGIAGSRGVSIGPAPPFFFSTPTPPLPLVPSAAAPPSLLPPLPVPPRPLSAPATPPPYTPLPLLLHLVMTGRRQLPQADLLSDPVTGSRLTFSNFPFLLSDLYIYYKISVS